ncbi:MAG TPA: general secretion pathway protein GspB [Gammaproteobacteria bacterium]|nr:general secretion pathway protein GspB [Gammaproteobacteria bacterium]
MSFILDALRKSEHERQRSTLPGLAQVPLAAPAAQLPRWALLLIGLLAAAVLVLGGAWWQSTRSSIETAANVPTVERPVPLPPAPSTPSAAVTTAAAITAPIATPGPAPEPAAPARQSGLAVAAGPGGTESRPAETPLAADEPALPSAAALAAQGIVVPTMRLELHRFRDEPRDRFVFINGRKYVEGDHLAEGPELVSILPTGAVLVQAGRRFLLVPE